MDVKKFALRSSSGDPYSVTVFFNADGVSGLQCSCKAGSFNEMCKHVRTFCECDSSLLHSDDQAETFREVAGLVLRSMVGSRYAKLQADIAHVAVEQKLLKQRVETLKRAFMQSMKSASQ